MLSFFSSGCGCGDSLATSSKRKHASRSKKSAASPAPAPNSAAVPSEQHRGWQCEQCSTTPIKGVNYLFFPNREMDDGEGDIELMYALCTSCYANVNESARAGFSACATEIESLAATFRFIDTDHSGTIDPVEFIEFYKALGVDGEQCYAAWQKGDIDGNGVIDADEFNTFFRSMADSGKM